MNQFKRNVLLAMAFIACLLAIGLPYWSIPYRQAQLPSALMGIGAVLVAVASLVLRWGRVATMWLIVLIIGGSVPAAVMARIAVEAAQDPTSHNLWPLEVMIALAVGWFWSALGALAGMVLGVLVAAPGATPHRFHSHVPAIREDEP